MALFCRLCVPEGGFEPFRRGRMTLDKPQEPLPLDIEYMENRRQVGKFEFSFICVKTTLSVNNIC